MNYTQKTITITTKRKYILAFKINFAEEYQVTASGLVFNTKYKRKVKRIYNNGSVGFYINQKFYTLKYLRTQLIRL